jgi:hypothetical protein
MVPRYRRASTFRPWEMKEKFDLITADFAYVRWLKPTTTWDRAVVDRREDLTNWVELFRQFVPRGPQMEDLLLKWIEADAVLNLPLRFCYRQSVYMSITVGSSVTEPAGSSFTLTPIRAESELQPNGAHPEVRRVPLASDSEMVNGMLCSRKNRATSAFFVPIFNRSWASSLMFSICRANAALSFLQSL